MVSSLKSRVLLLCAALVVLTSLSLLIIFWWNTSNFNQNHIDQRINNAENVLTEYLTAKEQLLFTASKVLTADFGFKQALATSDSGTIESVLLNHGSRINADLMVLLSLEGDIISSSLKTGTQQTFLSKSIKAISLKPQKAQFVIINQSLYEVIVLPVKAPRTIAYTIIGFEFDSAVLQELKRLTSLEVTFFNADKDFAISTRDLNGTFDPKTYFNQTMTHWGFLERPKYNNRLLDLNASADGAIQVFLSASMLPAYEKFNTLILSSIALSVIILVLAIFAGGIVSNSLVRPLLTLVELTRAFAKGEYPELKPDPKASVEIKHLHQRFQEMGQDIKEREQEVKYQADHDVLTGLLNRYTLMRELQQQLLDKRRRLIIACNIRHFKSINDTLGAATGDACLRAVAQRLLDYDDKTKCIHGRLGGDEFISSLVIPEQRLMQDLANDFLANLTQPIIVNDLKLNLNFYIGACVYPDHGDNAKALIRRTTIAMDASREESIPIRYYQSGEDEAHLSRLRLVDDLRKALKANNGELYLNYQPKLNLATQTIDKVESLIRWRKPNGDFVSPELFVGLAERSGLIIELTQWVIDSVLRQVSEWLIKGIKVEAAINVSAQDLAHPNFLEYLLAKLEQYKIEARQLTLELTERDIMINEDLVIERLGRLKTIGICISVDDYGIGQSSLGKLKQLPVDELKIDKTFIMQLDESKDDQNIVQSTIELGHKLGLSVVAEGVESRAGLQLLSGMQCDHAQGYFIARPSGPEEFAQWLENYEPV